MKFSFEIKSVKVECEGEMPTELAEVIEGVCTADRTW